MLEAFSDGMGAWKFVDVLGRPLVDLPDPQVHDLMQWRYLAQIAEEIKDKKRRNNKKASLHG